MIHSAALLLMWLYERVRFYSSCTSLFFLSSCYKKLSFYVLICCFLCENSTGVNDLLSLKNPCAQPENTPCTLHMHGHREKHVWETCDLTPAPDVVLSMSLTPVIRFTGDHRQILVLTINDSPGLTIHDVIMKDCKGSPGIEWGSSMCIYIVFKKMIMPLNWPVIDHQVIICVYFLGKMFQCEKLWDRYLNYCILIKTS